MAKMTRSALKGIVKECLVEILSEGLATEKTSSLAESRKRQTKIKLRQREDARLAEHRKKLETRTTDTISAVTDDPIMQQILAETAQTTLQDQIKNEIPGKSSGGEILGPPGGSAGIDLDSIFSGPSQNWAEMAFTESKTDG